MTPNLSRGEAPEFCPTSPLARPRRGLRRSADRLGGCGRLRGSGVGGVPLEASGLRSRSGPQLVDRARIPLRFPHISVTLLRSFDLPGSSSPAGRVAWGST